MSSESEKIEEDMVLQQRAVQIALSLMRGVVVSESISEEEYGESEGGNITPTNLRNMLEIAKEAKEKNSWDIFKLKVIYVARKASPGDDLYKFVRDLIRELSSEPDIGKRLDLAVHTLTAAIYIHNALRKGLGDLVYGVGS